MSSSSQVVVVVTVTVKDGRADEALELFADTIRQTHDEAGCLTYAVHRDLDEPNRFVLIERWTSSVAMEAHVQQPYVSHLFERVGDLLDGSPTIIRTAPVPVGDPVKGTL